MRNSMGAIDWRRALPRLFALLVILILVIIGVLFATGAFDSKEDKPADIAKPIQQPGKKTVSTTSSETVTTKPAESGGKTPTGQTATTSGAGSTASSNLSDTGPGETIALFVVTSAAGAFGYQLHLRRRLG